MKFRSSPYRHSVAILGLLFVPLLPIGKAQAAASVTLENWGGYVASFELEGAGFCKKINVGDIPLGQSKTVDLSRFDDCVAMILSGIPWAGVKFRVFYYDFWGWQSLKVEGSTLYGKRGTWYRQAYPGQYVEDAPLINGIKIITDGPFCDVRYRIESW